MSVIARAIAKDPGLKKKLLEAKPPNQSSRGGFAFFARSKTAKQKKGKKKSRSSILLSGLDDKRKRKSRGLARVRSSLLLDDA